MTMTKPVEPQVVRDAWGLELTVGGAVSLFIDLDVDAPGPELGSWIGTTAGSRYLVAAVRPVRHRQRGKVQRWQIRALRLPRHSPPPAEVSMMILEWHPRGRSS